MVTRRYPRRSILRAAGIGMGLAAVGGAFGAPTAAADDDAPAIAWARSYPGDEQEYEHTPRVLRQTADGGFVLGGEGAPIHRTGPEETQFSCMKLGDSGDPDWIAFGLDDHERELEHATDLVQLEDGGYVLVGDGEYHEEYERERWYEPIARAIKFAPDGEVEWTAVFDQFADDADEAVAVDGSPRLEALAPPADGGGPVAVGQQGGDGWAVKFADDGSVEWERRYPAVLHVADVFERDDGYRFHGSREDEQVVLHVDPSGSIEREIVLEVDYDAIPYNHVVIPTSDGGYALTGRYEGRQRMVLQKFDESGRAAWLETYNGPYDGYDWAFDVVQTDDDGFALFGRMDAAYTGDSVPAVVKTDAGGTETWRTLYEDEPRSRYETGIQTADGGYAAFNGGSNNFLVKYGTPAAAVDETSGDGGDEDEAGTGDSDGDGDEDPADGTEDEPSDDSEGEDGEQNATESGDQEDERDRSGSTTSDTGPNANGESDDADSPGGETDGGADTGSDGDDDSTGDEEAADEIPGFGLGAALSGLGGALLYRWRGRTERGGTVTAEGDTPDQG